MTHEKRRVVKKLWQYVNPFP